MQKGPVYRLKHPSEATVELLNVALVSWQNNVSKMSLWHQYKLLVAILTDLLRHFYRSMAWNTFFYSLQTEILSIETSDFLL